MEQRFGISLIALPNVDSMLTEVSFVADINSDELAFTELCLPHAKRFSAFVKVVVAANTDFKHIQTLSF
jgi:hypothetical protein